MSVCMYAHCTHRQMCLCIWLTMPSTSIVRILWETMKKQEARGVRLVYVCMCFSTFILFTCMYVRMYIKYAFVLTCMSVVPTGGLPLWTVGYWSKVLMWRKFGKILRYRMYVHVLSCTYVCTCVDIQYVCVSSQLLHPTKLTFPSAAFLQL